METGNYSSSGSWSYFLAPYSNTFGYVKNGSSVVADLLEPDVKNISLSKTKYIYDGKAKKPSVKVVNTNDKVLKQGKDYTVEYEKGRKSYGQYSVTVTLKGSYAGKEILYFDITPEAPEIKLTSGKKKITASWNNIKNAYGYKLEYSTDKNFPWDKTDTLFVYEGATKATVKSLKKNKKYYVRICSFIYTDEGYIWSDWSETKTVKTKK